MITNCIYDISTKGNVIEIPDVLDNQTITGIGDYAFSIAGKIAILTLPSTLKTIGYGVFEGHALTSLVIPAGVTSIGGRAFYGNALSSINLPAGLETIADETFANNQLNNITLPAGLKSIGWGAFQNNKITSLTIPNSVLTINVQAFYGNRISDLNFESGCQLKEITDNCFAMNDIKTLAIPNSVLIIGVSAFYYNQNLKNVTFGNNLLKIKRSAFYYCNISSLNFPGSLVFIGRYAFDGNNNLNGFKLPVSAKNYLWNDSNGDKHAGGDLVTIKYYSYVAIIPYTLTNNDVTVQGGVITSCSYYDDITHTGSVITIPDMLDGQNIVGVGPGVFYDRGISELVLPKGIKEISNQAFAFNEIIDLNIPASLNEIGTEAFINNCINSLVFEPTSDLEFIGMSAFGWNRLITIDFPESVVKIEKFAFDSNGIQNITFDANSKLLSIGSGAFNNNGMVSFKLPDPKANYWVDWDNNQYTTNLVVTNFESFYKIPIEYTLTDADVVVVNGVITSCSLKNPNANILTIPETLDGQKIIGVGNGVFRALGLIGVNFPSTLQTIYYGAFGDNDILKVTIPSSVVKIEGEAFYRNNINELVFEPNSRLKQVDWGAFYINRITSLTLPDSLTHINNYAFGNNRIANNLIIPDNITYIGWGAFNNNQIPQVIFGNNSTLTYLGNYAFASNLISNEIHIPKTLTEISDYAFYYNLISKVIVHDGIVDYGNGAFEYNDPSLKIILHKPPTIPFVTHFFGWKDSNGVYHNPGETITDFSIRYKAVIDQFFVVKFVVVDDNSDPVEDASIQFYNATLITNENGIDSVGPVMRGLQDYNVSAAGCQGVIGNVDVQDNMTVNITLTRYYNVNITVLNAGNNPITGADIALNGTVFISDTKGKANTKLPDGDYPYVVNVAGFKEVPASFTVHDSDTSVVVVLSRVAVNYFPNNGTGNTFTDITSGSTYITQNNTYTRIAYTFSHWNTTSDNSGIKYTEKEVIPLFYADVDLYAIWKPVDFNIIYHLDGGTNDPANPAKYNIESEITILPADKPSLYFSTWVDADGNRVSEINKGISGDLELWAVFTTEPTYFIDYYYVENANHNNLSSYTKFDLPMVFTDAIKKGYGFIGWYIDPLLTASTTTIPFGSTKNYDVYAKWSEALIYTINYILDGGKNNPANPADYTIESNQINFESPAKTGAAFMGWFSDNVFTKKITGIPGGSAGDTTIYAKWELDTFDIQYVLNGGLNNPANPLIYTIESVNIKFETPAKTGADFMGWYSDKNLTGKISGLPHGSYGDTMLYAKWELAKFDINYVLNGGVNHAANPTDYTIESNQINFESPAKTGAAFMGWFSDNVFTKKITGIPGGNSGDTTIYAKWELDTFDIQYVLNGGLNNPANPVIYTIESANIKFETPAKTGADFMGWYSDKNLTGKISGLPHGSYGDTMLYAKWELTKFDINYILNGGVNHPANPADYTIESNQINFESPEKTGAAFMGWFSDNVFTKKITGIPGGSSGDTTIYAKWELDTFDIQYVLNGGLNHPANPSKYTIESDDILLEYPEKEGYFFDGWYTDSNYSGVFGILPKGSTGNKTLYAKWLEVFKVNFIITTDSIHPASDIEVVINNAQKLWSDSTGIADTLIPDGSTVEYSIEINGIVIENGSVDVSGSDVTIQVAIVDCYLRWWDVLFCDNGKGLWTEFEWVKDNTIISEQQFFHNKGGIKTGSYKLMVTAVNGQKYTWEKSFGTDAPWKRLKEPGNNFMILFPNPVSREAAITISLSDAVNLETSIIYLYNVYGDLIKTIDKPYNMNTIIIGAGFSSGRYHVLLRDEINNLYEMKDLIVY